MTTVDDKLKLFAKMVFDKVEKDSEKTVSEFTDQQDKLLEEERLSLLKQSEDMLKQYRKKAEDRKKQILAKANIDRQHAILIKRKEIFDGVVQDIKNLSVSLTNDSLYIPFLEKCISTGFLKLDGREIEMLFTTRDMNKYREEIDGMINKYKSPDLSVTVNSTGEEIIGGCIFQNIDRTFRIDCSMSSLLDESKELIGKVLMDNLQ